MTYRTEALVITQRMAVCVWCKHYRYDVQRGYTLGHRCLYTKDALHPVRGKVAPRNFACDDFNPDGLCSDYTPSIFTKIVQLFGGRKAPEVKL